MAVDSNIPIHVEWREEVTMFLKKNRLFRQALASPPIHLTLTTGSACASLFLFGAFAFAQNYPPYGPDIPVAHFDRGKRPHVTPPPPKLMCPVLSSSCKDARTAQSEWNTQLLGYDSLDGRSTYQPLVVHQGNRYMAYMAHHAGCAINRLNLKNEVNGTSLLDVTDPQHPIYLSHIPNSLSDGATCTGSLDAAGNQMVHVCGGDNLPFNSKAEADRKRGRYYMLRTNGNASGQPGAESHEVWDVTNPSSPTLLTTIDSGATNTHKDWWECYSGVAYLVASATKADSAQGWQHSGSTQHIKIYNLHDPANPEYIRDFGFVGQQPSATGSAPEGLVTPPTGIHGPISAGDRIYAAYGVGSNGVVQTSTAAKF
jgi:hypothetical protein